MLPKFVRAAITDYTSTLRRIYPSLLPPDGPTVRALADSRARLIEAIESALAATDSGEG